MLNSIQIDRGYQSLNHHGPEAGRPRNRASRGCRPKRKGLEGGESMPKMRMRRIMRKKLKTYLNRTSRGGKVRALR